MPKLFTRRAAKSPNPVTVVPYRGYASSERLFLKGRVLEEKAWPKPKGGGSFRHFLESVRRFETDEVAGAKLSVRLGENHFAAETDHEGYFEIDAQWQSPPLPTENRWLTAEVQLKESPVGQIPVNSFSGEVLFPSKNAEFGIISDIDDTVLQTHTTSWLKLKMLYITFFKDSHHRLPVEGIPELLDSLVRGGDGRRKNPIFYVSDSPWNLYDLLADFMALQNLPKGPIILRDYGTHMLKKFIKRPAEKLSSLHHILEQYPGLPFLMLGDTASKDADYYIQMAKKFDGRVLAIYIRQASNNRNARRVAKLIEEHSYINAVIVKSSAEILAHARKTGFVK